MTIYDKARWQLDGGIPQEQVIQHFDFIFKWLKKQGFLSKDGQEIMDLGIDDTVSITDKMLTSNGKHFMDQYYDDYLKVIKYGVEEDEDWLNERL